MAQFPKIALRIVRALACIALLISGYLIYQKATGQISSLAGCGGEGGCSNVLGGRWASWFLIPVTVFAAALYIAVLIAAWPSLARARPQQSAFVLRTAAVLAGGAAVWFFGLLIFVEKSFCAYCAAMHACGLALAVIVFGPARRSLPATSQAPFALGVLGLAALIVGQLLGPQTDTHELATIPGVGSPSSKTPAQADAQLLNFGGGQIQLRRSEVPSVGPANPKYYLVEIFDYTCKSCRTMHRDLGALREARPGAFAILYLPCPLNRACNPFLPSGVPDHQYACELANIALSVWKADPEKFAQIHDYLMTTSLPILPTDAEAKAISLVGADAFRAAARSPEIAGLLSQTFGHYALLSRGDPTMPQLLLGGTAVLRGTAKDTGTFVSLMIKHFQL